MVNCGTVADCSVLPSNFEFCCFDCSNGGCHLTTALSDFKKTHESASTLNVDRHRTNLMCI